MTSQAKIDAYEHLIFNLTRIAENAAFQAEGSAAAAEGTRDPERSVRYQRDAEAERELATIARRMADIARRDLDNKTLATRSVLGDVLAERIHQVAKWGEQHREDGTGGPVMHRMAEDMRDRCNYLAENGGADWRAVLLEEVYEAMAESDPKTLRAELTQVAAVCVAWIEDIDSRTEPSA